MAAGMTRVSLGHAAARRRGEELEHAPGHYAADRTYREIYAPHPAKAALGGLPLAEGHDALHYRKLVHISGPGRKSRGLCSR